MIQKIAKPNNTVRNKDLEKTWHSNQVLKNMISKRNKLTHEQYYQSISKQRLKQEKKSVDMTDEKSYIEDVENRASKI